MNDAINNDSLGTAPQPADMARRSLLQLAAGMAASGPLAVEATSSTGGILPPLANGKPGDFHFLSGNWIVRHRRLQDGQWDMFEGEASVVEILGGVASVEELRIPSRQFSGMGLRLLDVGRKLWADYWVNGKNGVLTPPPSWGSFVNGVGTWESAEQDGGQTILVRGVWDQITADSCRWYQTVSRDQGRSWQENWVMQWSRVGAAAN